MKKLATAIAIAGLIGMPAAHAFETNSNTPTTHQFNPSAPPPSPQTGMPSGKRQHVTGSSSQGGGSGQGKVMPAMRKAGGKPLQGYPLGGGHQ